MPGQLVLKDPYILHYVWRFCEYLFFTDRLITDTVLNTVNRYVIKVLSMLYICQFWVRYNTKRRFSL